MRRLHSGCRSGTRIALLLAAAAAGGAGTVHAQDHHHPAGDVEGIGRVAFEVTCAPDAAARFGRAVAMLHSFWFEAAEAEFSAVLQADPSCAMAHWGRAMTLMGNPMTRAAPSAAAMAEGLAAARHAADAASGVSHREQMYIDAALAFFGEPDDRDHAARSAALEQALEALYRAHPEDNEAAIFYGRTLVANAPPDDHTFERQLRAAAIMEPLFQAQADHPGLAHYLIHAYDAPPLAENGTHAARAYAAIAPAAPHALHMPSHIFTRLGYWDESIETNARSAQAEPNPDAAVHPMDYKVYAYLQQGRDAEAKRVLDRAVENPDRFYGGLLGYNFAAMPARFALEREAWADAAQLKLPVGALPYVEAITRFARAIGAARSGAHAQAAPEVEALDRLRGELAERGDREWATRVEAQQLAAAAWVAQARGDRDEALRLAREAAEKEDMIEKHPVTPGPLLPARELLGDLLVEAGQHAEAQSEYEKTLEREPRRARTLHGAARAAQLAGNAEAAKRHFTELLEVMSKADADRREVAEARRFLNRSG
jgi:tetratricopeptide (TPR) repeat protein